MDKSKVFKTRVLIYLNSLSKDYNWKEGVKPSIVRKVESKTKSVDIDSPLKPKFKYKDAITSKNFNKLLVFTKYFDFSITIDNLINIRRSKFWNNVRAYNKIIDNYKQEKFWILFFTDNINKLYAIEPIISYDSHTIQYGELLGLLPRMAIYNYVIYEVDYNVFTEGRKKSLLRR